MVLDEVRIMGRAPPGYFFCCTELPFHSTTWVSRHWNKPQQQHPSLYRMFSALQSHVNIAADCTLITNTAWSQSTDRLARGPIGRQKAHETTGTWRQCRDPDSIGKWKWWRKSNTWNSKYSHVLQTNKDATEQTDLQCWTMTSFKGIFSKWRLIFCSGCSEIICQISAWLFPYVLCYNA